MDILIYYDGQPLFLYPAVAKRLNLVEGQHLSSHDEFLEVLNLNAMHYALLRLASELEVN